MTGNSSPPSSTSSTPSPYKKTTGEKVLLVFAWILIILGAFLIFFLAAGIFTAMVFAIPIIAGIIMHYYANKRVKQLKKKQQRFGSGFDETK